MSTQTQPEIKVFICYAREDQTTAKRLYDDLKGAGVLPWMDTEDLLPGQNWKIIIPKVLKESSYVLVLLSSHSVSKRGFVQKELKKALDLLDEFSPYDIFVIPVRLDECQPADERLQALHWVDLFPSYETGLDQILRVLAPDSSTRQATDRQAAAQSPSTMETHSTTQRRDALEKECELLNEKIAHLRKAKIIETDAAVRFKLTKQIEELEHQRERLEHEIASVVSKDQTKPSSAEPAPSEGKQKPLEISTQGDYFENVGGNVYTGPVTIHQYVEQQEPEKHATKKRQQKAEPQEEAKPRSKQKPSRKVQKPPIISLRSEPLTVSEKEFREIFKLDKNKRPLTYIQNQLEGHGEVIVDHATGLMWQKSGSAKRLTSYRKVQAYVARLNREQFSGYDNWRLPTVEELMSLLESKKSSNGLYINRCYPPFSNAGLLCGMPWPPINPFCNMRRGRILPAPTGN